MQSRFKSRLTLLAIISPAIFLLLLLYVSLDSSTDGFVSKFPLPAPPPPLAPSSPPLFVPIEAGGNYPQLVFASKTTESAKATEVKNAFLHAWSSYDKYAWGADELMPKTTGPKNNFNGWGVTIVDSLDTLLLMGLEPEFNKAVQHVYAMTFGGLTSIPFFETIIRYLGGLLSAYALVADHDHGSVVFESWQNKTMDDREQISSLLLHRAKQLADLLLPAFDTDSGLPGSWLQRDGKISGTRVVLAEIGSCQMEFKYLAYLTGDRKYFDVVAKVDRILYTIQSNQVKGKSELGGMLPEHYTTSNGLSNGNHIGVGAGADSTYEYFLKGYLLSGRAERNLLDMYLKSVDTALRKLTFVSSGRNLTYIVDAHGSSPVHRLEALSCFYPGLLSLGIEHLSEAKEAGSRLNAGLSRALERHRMAAEAIAETCYLMYRNNPSGLGFESINFRAPGSSWWAVVDEWEKHGKARGEDAPRGLHGNMIEMIAGDLGDKMEYRPQDSRWLMRPEAIESMYLNYRRTKDPIWQDRCYTIFRGIERSSRVKNGYASVRDSNLAIDSSNPRALTNLDDSMPSYALAEVFKYLYLCMLDPSESEKLLPWDRWLFNTEAHPLPVFQWSEKQVKQWHIQ